MLDRAEFPRDKPCGGGVNLRAVRLLPFDIAPVAERPISGMRISIRQGRSYLRYAPAPISYLTQRRRLDAFLAERAESAGAAFRQRAAVRGVEREGRKITVRAGREAFTGRSLVAADGANGPAARLAGIRVDRSKEIALEGNITPKSGYPVEWVDVFGIDVGAVPGGYGWLFPKGDHLNIGVGGLCSIGPTLRARLDCLTRFYGFDPRSFWGLRGHPLPVRRPGSPLIAGNVLVTGDAAGLLDPMSGEGIYAAVWSGRAAARRLFAYLSGSEKTLDGYRADIEREIEPDLVTARQLHALFHLAPHLWARFVRRSPRAWRLICGLATGDTTYTDVKKRSALLAFGIDLAATLIERASPKPPALRSESR
jgi:geranylgeranyl reductase family protein